MDYETTWSYYWHKVKRFVTDRHYQTKFMTVVFIVLLGALLIQGAYVMHLFGSSEKSISPANAINITTPTIVYLNKPFPVSLQLLTKQTTYQLSLLDQSYMMRPQQTFLANETSYQTKITLLSDNVLTNNTARLLVVEPYTTSVVASITVSIGGLS